MSDTRRKPPSKHEITLTVLIIAVVLITSLALLYDFRTSTTILLFCILLLAFLLVEALARPKEPVSSPLTSHETKIPVRLKNRKPGTVNVAFQWPERSNNLQIEERIYLRAKSATAEYFSSLSEPPGHAELRAYIMKAVKQEVRSLKVRRIEVLIQDIEIKDGSDDDGHHGGIVLGRLRS